MLSSCHLLCPQIINDGRIPHKHARDKNDWRSLYLFLSLKKCCEEDIIFRDYLWFRHKLESALFIHGRPVDFLDWRFLHAHGTLENDCLYTPVASSALRYNRKWITGSELREVNYRRTDAYGRIDDADKQFWPHSLCGNLCFEMKPPPPTTTKVEPEVRMYLRRFA